jgi:hypothetical protein
VGDVRDVEPPGGDVGRDEEVRLSGAEQPHDPIPFALRHAAVKRLAPVAMGIEGLGQLVHLEPRAAEDHRGRRVLHFEHARERRRLLPAGDDIGDLAQARQFSGGRLLAANRHMDRVPHVAPRDRDDARRDRGREERGLARRGRRGEDRFQVFREPHVEHLVRFVEHEKPEPIELEVSAADVIERAAGCRHRGVDAPLQGADLLIHRRAAEERSDMDAEAPAVLVDGLGDLHRQLPRRDEDESGRATPGRGPFRDPLEERERERRGLSGSGRRLAEHVAPSEEYRNRLALDRRRLFVAESGHGCDERSREPERGESGRCVLSEAGFPRCFRDFRGVRRDIRARRRQEGFLRHVSCIARTSSLDPADPVPPLTPLEAEPHLAEPAKTRELRRCLLRRPGGRMVELTRIELATS